MPNDLVSIDPTIIEQPEPVSIDTGEPLPAPLTEPVINARAIKASFGTNRPIDDLSSAISSGQELRARQETAAELDYIKQQGIQKKISDISIQRGGPLTSNEIQDIYRSIDFGQKFTNPKSVFEEEFSKKYLDILYKTPVTNPGTWFDDALREVPEYVHGAIEAGKGYLALDEYLRTKYHDVEANARSQSLGGWAGDKLKEFATFGLYSEVKLRALGKSLGIPMLGSGLGSNQEAIRIALYRLPLQEAIAKITPLIDDLEKDNPSMAAEFISSLLGRSEREISGANFGTALTVGFLPGISTAANVTRRTLMGKTNRAVEDMVRSAVDFGPSQDKILSEAWLKSVGHTGSGNLSEAGIQTATHNLNLELSGKANPILQAQEELPRFLKMQEENLRANPGADGQEVANRLTDQSVNSKNNILNVISNFLRVSRTPGPLAAEQSQRLLWENIKDKYPGLANRFINTGGPFITHPYSGSVHVEMKIGDEGAVLFNRQEQAAEFARTQGIVLKGTDKMERQLELQRQLTITEGTLGYYREVAQAMADDAQSAMFLGLRFKASPERRLELQKLIKGAEEQLDYYKRLMVASPEQLDKLGLTAANKTKDFNKGYADTVIKLKNYKEELAQPSKDVNFEKNIKDLEAKYAADTQELSEIRKAPGADIVPQGTGFYISKWEPINEKSKVMRDLLTTTEASQTPKSGLINSVIGWVRTPADTVSKNSNIAALTGAYGSSTLLQLAQQEMQEAAKLARWTFPGTERRQRWLDFKRTIDANLTDGKLFQTIPELEHFYLTTFDRAPIEAEKAAYFAYQRFVELDAMYRELTIYKNKSVVGTESHRFSFRDKNGNRITSAYVDGIEQTEFPGGESSILVTGAGVRGLARTMTKQQMPSKLEATLKEEIAQGKAKVIRLYAPETYPLRSDPAFKDIVGNSRIRYIISREVETKPLSFKQLPNRMAGHLENDYEHSIKQANITKDPTSGLNWYNGDKTVLLMNVRTMAQDVLKKMENVRVLLNAGKDAEAEIAARQLPFSWEKHSGWYKESRGPGGEIIPPVLKLDLPLHVVSRNRTIIETDRSLKDRFIDRHGENSFRDGTKLSSDAQQYAVKDPSNRDSHEVLTVSDKGSRGNPLYSYEAASHIDPITSMNRAITRISHSTFMDDYKTFAMEHWLQEAKQWLKGSPDEIAHAPLHYFHNGVLLEDTPFDIKMRLEASRFKAKQIIGTPGITDSFLHALSQKLSDTIYTKVGPTKLDPSWMIPKLTDGGRFIKAVTYNALVGLLSPAQLLVQSVTFATMAGIEGFRLTGHGVTGAFLHQLSRINSNPEILKTLDGIATKMGWRPGEWLEAREAVGRTGFLNVGGEHAFLDNPLSGKVFNNAGTDLLNIGQVFFRESERNVRMGAWYASHKKFREAAPTGRLADSDLGSILQNADLLSGNMSSAHKSLIQRGPLGFTTQFLSYNLRLAEQMWGGRLTAIQKMRLFSVYGSLFGVSALGLAGFPAGDIMRTEAIKHGYTGDLSHLSTWVTEGLPSAMIQMATGKSYNIGQRFGNVGLDQLRDAMTSDKPMMDLLGGASYSTFKGIFEQSDGIRSHIGSLFRDSNEYFPLTQEDLLKPLKQVSVGNNISRLKTALETGNWMSKKGQKLDEGITPIAAILMSATGVQPQRVGDIRNVVAIEKERKEHEQNTEKQFIEVFGKYSQAVADRDANQVTDYGKQMRAILKTSGYPIDKYSTLISRAAKGNESLVNNMDRSLYTRGVAPDQKDMMIKAYQEKLKMQQGIQ